MNLASCLVCHRPAKPLTITDDGCQNCRAEAARAAHPGRVLTMGDVRRQRNRLLARTDKASLPDGPGANKLAIAAKRQALRDVPQTHDGDVAAGLAAIETIRAELDALDAL